MTDQDKAEFDPRSYNHGFAAGMAEERAHHAARRRGGEIATQLRTLTAIIDGADGYDPDEWIVEAATIMDAAAERLEHLGSLLAEGIEPMPKFVDLSNWRVRVREALGR